MFDLEAAAEKIIEYSGRGDPVKDACDLFGVMPEHLLIVFAREYLAELRIKVGA